MTCGEYQEQVSQYIDGELGEQDSAGLFSHLSKCKECRMSLKGFLELRSSIQDEILKGASAEGRQLWKKRRVRMSMATALATVAAIIMITIVFFETVVRPERNEATQVVYMMSLPIIEVQGENPNYKPINQ